MKQHNMFASLVHTTYKLPMADPGPFADVTKATPKPFRIASTRAKIPSTAIGFEEVSSFKATTINEKKVPIAPKEIAKVVRRQKTAS